MKRRGAWCVLVLMVLLLAAPWIALAATEGNPEQSRGATDEAMQTQEAGIGAGIKHGAYGIGAGLAIGLAGIGVGIAQARIGSAGVGALAENPKLMGNLILLIAIPETIVILGFVIAFMILGGP
ncbi:MAG: V-type ATP synthase subunit K [Candidatus Omnitrophota bacterium]